MAYPTIVFGHGAWHNVEFFRKVIAILEPLGYRCVTVPLPSASGRVPPTTSLDEDIAAIRNAVVKELDAGYDVMMNAHSWGGIPTSTALEGLTKPERLESGKTTGVMKLTFVASFIVPEATSLIDSIGGEPVSDWVIDGDGNMTVAVDHRQFFYHDVDPNEVDEWLDKLKPHSVASFTTKTTSAAWKRVPAAYLICEDDQAIPVAFQETLIEKAKEEGGEIATTRLSVSHSPYLSKPDAVANFLRTEIGEPLN